MAGAKEIRTKIKSVKSTQKITRAMEMVAASKMRNVQMRMNHARPYANKIRQVIAHVGQAYSEYKHPYLVPREVKRVGFIVVSSDRGLCGGLNSNLFRAVVNATKELSANDIGVRYCVFGGKALAFFKRVGGRVLAEASGLGDKPHLQQLIGPVKVMLDAYASGEIDKLVLVSNSFVNTMTQKPTLETLLPVSQPVDPGSSSWDYIYEPGAPEVLGTLLDRYIESLVYQSVIENGACEQAARMVAMKSATENAGNLIDELQTAYNKARQASITQEIAEIVSGAAAV